MQENRGPAQHISWPFWLEQRPKCWTGDGEKCFPHCHPSGRFQALPSTSLKFLLWCFPMAAVVLPRKCLSLEHSNTSPFPLLAAGLGPRMLTCVGGWEVPMAMGVKRCSVDVKWMYGWSSSTVTPLKFSYSRKKLSHFLKGPWPHR